MGGIAALLGLSAFTYYLYGVYPSVSVGDAGEFITAAWTLGVPHPPGFPLYTLLGHVFAVLLPWGNPAYRLNVFSALTAAACVALFFILLRHAGVQRWIALGCTLVLALSPALTANARASEVFALNAFFTVAVFYAAERRRWTLAFFLLGLGAGNHQIILALAPVLGLLLLCDETLPAALRWRALAVGLVCFVLALTVYGVLILRAQTSPVLDVGHADSPGRLWRVITRADYGSLTLALGETPARTLKNTAWQVRRLVNGLSRQCTWLLIVAALIGWIQGSEKSRRAMRFAIGALLMLGPAFFILGNLPFDAQSNGLLGRFYIAPALALLLLAARGLQALFAENRWVSVGLMVGAVAWQAAAADMRGFRNDYMAYAYGRNNLRSLPPNARLFMDGGDDTFYTLAYLTQVQRLRPDLILHDRGGVVFAHPYGDDFRGLDSALKEERRQGVELALVHAGVPVYYSTMNPTILANAALDQEGILYAARPVPPAHAPNPWPFYDFRGVPPWDAPMRTFRLRYRSRALAPFYAYQAAIAAGRSGDIDQGWAYLKTANAIGPDVLWLKPNIIHTAQLWAYQAFNDHHLLLSRDLYRWILTLQSDDTLAQQNLRVIEQQLAPHA